MTAKSQAQLQKGIQAAQAVIKAWESDTSESEDVQRNIDDAVDCLSPISFPTDKNSDPQAAYYLGQLNMRQASFELSYGQEENPKNALRKAREHLEDAKTYFANVIEWPKAAPNTVLYSLRHIK